MKSASLLKIFAPAAVIAVFGLALAQNGEKDGPPLKVLLVAGGCCHDYAIQTQLLKTGIEQRLNAEVTIFFNPDRATTATFEIYEHDDWAEGYDVVLHDECSASVTDPAYVKRILNAHKKGTPAVNLHCAMHSYRWGDFRSPVEIGADNSAWYEMIGLQSTGHGPQAPIDVRFTNPKHPITAGMENWTTIQEELYNNVQIYEGTTALATGVQLQKPRAKKGQKPDANAKPKEARAVVVWANEYGPNKTRIFSMSLGHNNETVADDRYLDLVARGLMWSVGKLGKDGTVAAADETRR